MYKMSALLALMVVPIFANATTLGEKMLAPQPGSTISAKAAKANMLFSASTYTVVSHTTNQVTIREYVNKDGYVFAVSWMGPVKPNLVELLGQYSDVLRGQQSVSHNNVSVNNEDVVINSGGRLRNFYGTALVPKLAPSGFSFE